MTMHQVVERCASGWVETVGASEWLGDKPRPLPTINRTKPGTSYMSRDWRQTPLGRDHTTQMKVARVSLFPLRSLINSNHRFPLSVFPPPRHHIFAPQQQKPSSDALRRRRYSTPPVVAGSTRSHPRNYTTCKARFLVALP